ncbi:hypothetical protein [Micromonospora sp. RV43]|uniref:hypothetical protein n=1 Tax=Micromonospora sp. RV43 TaxID=1661387 RepID=UPI00064BE8A6|nr:hypothetical protein [Micromonospora sp. RV43]
MTTLVPLTYAALAQLPARIGARVDFNGPVPPDPLRPITAPCRKRGHDWTNPRNVRGGGMRVAA